MAEVKNEHIVYAYAPLLQGGGCVILVGVTQIGFEYLRKENGNYLKVEPPPGAEFRKVEQVWVVWAKDKREIHEMLQTTARQMGVTLHFPS